MRIRQASSEHYPEIAALWHDSARLMDGGVHDLPSVEALLNRINHEVVQGCEISIAVDGEIITGFAATIPDRGILDQLFVARHNQGRGVGDALLAAVKEAMPGGFTLRTLTSNENAQRFYVARGLRCLGDDFHPTSGLPVRYYAWTTGKSGRQNGAAQIYLLRHGETEWNAAGRFQGILDSPLTGKGIEQAKASGRRLASLIAHADAVHASPLGRVRQTCTIITSFNSYPAPLWDARLREVSIGSWDGLTEIDIEEGWPGLLDGATAFDWFFRSPDGETYDEAAARVRRWLSEVEGTVVVVSHGLLGRIIRGEYLGLSRHEALSLPVPQDVIWHLAAGKVSALKS